MYENLVVGLESSRQPPIDAVITICDAMGLPPRWLDFLRVSANPRAKGANRLRKAVSLLIRLRRLRKSRRDDPRDASWVTRPVEAEAAAHEALWTDHHADSESPDSNVRTVRLIG